MIGSTSAGTGNSYPTTMVCESLGVARSTIYAQATAKKSPEPKKKRGPKPLVSDADLLTAIREELANPAFHGEGHKKVRFRLRNGPRHLKVGKNRVLRLMRENCLLAPVRRLYSNGKSSHDGKIISDRPNDMWGADGTCFWTDQEGMCWFFGVIDHFNSECVGIEIAKHGNRWAVIESLRSAVKNALGSFGTCVARGVKLRHDWGSQYTAHATTQEIKFLGFADSPAYVGEPETNGVAERFMRTLKEHCIYLHHFKTLEEAKAIIADFVRRYNEGWILERLGYKTPAQARKDFILQNQAVAVGA